MVKLNILMRLLLGLLLLELAIITCGGITEGALDGLPYLTKRFSCSLLVSSNQNSMHPLENNKHVHQVHRELFELW